MVCFISHWVTGFHTLLLTLLLYRLGRFRQSYTIISQWFFFLQVYDSCSNHSILSVSERLRASAAGLNLSVRPVCDSADVL